MSGIVFLHWTQRHGVEGVASACNKVKELLICEVVGEGLTRNVALEICGEIYPALFKSFGPKLLITAPTLGLGSLDSYFPIEKAFVLDESTEAEARARGFNPEFLNVTQNLSPRNPATWHPPESLSSITNKSVVLAGPMEQVGLNELLALSVCGLMGVRQIKVEVNGRRSTRIVKEELMETAHILLPDVDIQITHTENGPKTIELRDMNEGILSSFPAGLEDFYEILNSRSKLTLSPLKTRWNSTSSLLSIPLDLRDYWFERLCRLYSDHRRAYHTLFHIYQMLEKTDSKPQNPALELAIWFHDAVYCSEKKDNEEKSAELFQSFAEETSLQGLEKVKRWILSTKTHRPESDDEDECWLLDLDLSILGAEENVYEEYARGIYAEYGWIGEAEYRIQRVKVLEHFLSREFLYFTNEGRSLYETKARSNIRKEISQLEDPTAAIRQENIP